MIAKRRKSLKFDFSEGTVIDSEFINDILSAAVALTTVTIGFKCFRDQLDLQSLRDILHPAYIQIGLLLANVKEGEVIAVNDIHDLDIHMYPTHGYVELKFAYMTKDNDERYKITINAADGKTIFIRGVTRPMIVAGKDRVEETTSELTKL